MCSLPKEKESTAAQVFSQMLALRVLPIELPLAMSQHGTGEVCKHAARQSNLEEYRMSYLLVD